MGTTQIVVTSMLMEGQQSGQQAQDGSLIPLAISMVLVALIAWCLDD